MAQAEAGCTELGWGTLSAEPRRQAHCTALHCAARCCTWSYSPSSRLCWSGRRRQSVGATRSSSGEVSSFSMMLRQQGRGAAAAAGRAGGWVSRGAHRQSLLVG